jgi:phosphatidate cytidylyltransferase
MNEFYNLARIKSKGDKWIGILGGVYLFTATFLYAGPLEEELIFLPYILFLMYLLISELYKKEADPIRNCGFHILGQIYCAGSLSLLNFIAFLPDEFGEVNYSWVFLMAIFIFVWLNDTGAYLIGTAFGKHRLFERISPLKSWEGFFGGWLVVLIFSLFCAWYTGIEWYIWVGFASTVVIFGTLGDLSESLLKRTFGAKDSGKFFPGHGGILDRFDSVILATPAAYIFIELFIRN